MSHYDKKKADVGCGGKSNSHLMASCVKKYLCQKLLKSDNPSSSYNRKCWGCFLRHYVYDNNGPGTKHWLQWWCRAAWWKPASVLPSCPRLMDECRYPPSLAPNDLQQRYVMWRYNNSVGLNIQQHRANVILRTNTEVLWQNAESLLVPIRQVAARNLQRHVLAGGSTPHLPFPWWVRDPI